MAKKSSVAKQKKRERIVARRHAERQLLKKSVKDQNLSFEEREAAMMKLNSLPRDSSAVRLRNRCQITGRARGYLRRFKISRLCFREMANEGLIPGVVKASW